MKSVAQLIAEKESQWDFTMLSFRHFLWCSKVRLGRKVALDDETNEQDRLKMRHSTNQGLNRGLHIHMREIPQASKTMNATDATPARDEIGIVFEDADLLVASKPRGLLSENPEKKDSDPGLLEILIEKYKTKFILLHRLDRGTSGLILLAKNREAAGEMSRAFEEKRIRKSYFAIVSGLWPKEINRIESKIFRLPEGRWVSREEGPGSRALTTFRLLATGADRSLIEALPKTGRTHQIRLHAAGTGHPLLGDKLYGYEGEELPAFALHAGRLSFRHPRTSRDLEFFLAPEPLRVYGLDFEIESINDSTGEKLKPKRFRFRSEEKT